LLVVFSVLFGICPEAQRALAEGGPSYRIIVHPDNPTSKASRQFLANAFLKEVTRWDGGESLRPVDLKPQTTTRRRFSESILNRSVGAVKSYWQQRIFSGRGVPPPELDSDEAVVAYVTKHRGGVGYVSPAADIGKARVVRVD
jgi:ABC-type phosphate transport system substrate-binding protein